MSKRIDLKVRLTPEQHEALKIEAFLQGRTMQEVVVEALRKARLTPQKAA